MEVKLLPKSVRDTLRSEVNIRSIAKCIAQLVFNSIDAKSASIAVRINLVTFKIQVVDNGSGISKKNLKLVGFRHATSKYYSVEDLKKNPYIFPSRGEALASIIKLSETVKITTRGPDKSKTFSKVFENGKTLFISSVKHRPSKGTTIIIENFMYNLPVRKKSINHNTCLEEIKNEIEYIALIHPNTSFSLRNDSSGEIIFHTYRSKYVFQTTAILFGKEFSRQLRKICYNDKNFSISGLISINSHAQNKIQFVYINSRFVSKNKIHTLINALISKSKIIKNKETDSPMMKQKHAAFIINIKCPYTELDIVDYIQPEIEFKNWENVLTCVEDAITQFLKTKDLIQVKERKKNYLQNGSPLKEIIPDVRTSQVAGVIRGIPIKRKLPNSEKSAQSISSNKNENNKQIKVVVDVHSPPKKILLEKLPSPQKPESIEKINEKHNKTLESNSEYGKNIIMDMFLKSTTVFRNDNDLKTDELLTFDSAEKYTNRSSSTCFISTLKNNCNKTSFTTSTKISITKTIEQNVNINSNHKNNDNTVFKVPHTPKLPKRKRSTTTDSLNVSNILARERNKQQISVPKDFQLDFIKNISESNNLPIGVTNRFSKLIDNFAKESNNNYKCTIKITKRLNYLQSSDFLQPATKRLKSIPTAKPRYKNIRNVKKEIVHANSMIKTYYDFKNNVNHHHKMQCRNLSYLKNKNNSESLSSTFKNEYSQNVVPIYNIKRNYYPLKNNYNKEKYYEPRSKIERLKYDNTISLPRPQILFKPFSTNPHLSNLFCKNNIPIAKPNLYLNYDNASSDKVYENRNKNKYNSDIYIAPTFESHQFTKNCYNNKQNIESNLNDPVSMFKKPKNYFDLINKQNGLQIFELKKNNKSETVTAKSNFPIFPEITPIKISHNIDQNNKHTFLNYLQTKITPENNNKYEISKNTVESNITFLPKIIPLPETPLKNVYNTSRNNKNIFSNYLQTKITPENNNENLKKTVESNITFLPEIIPLPETPIKIPYNTNKINEHTFSNYFQTKITPENNKKSENSKNTIESNITFLPEIISLPETKITPENNNKYENAKKTVESNITFLPEIISLPETPVRISYNTNKKNENTFSNYFQTKITPENNKKYENSKNTIESNISFLPEIIPSPETKITPENNNNYENSKKTVESNITFLPENISFPETSIKISYNTNRNNEHTFSNNLQTKITPENNKCENILKTEPKFTFLPETLEVSETPMKISYNTQNNIAPLNYFESRKNPENNIKNDDKTDILNWVENTKKFLQSSFISDKVLNNTPKKIQQKNGTSKDIGNIKKGNIIKKCEKLKCSNFMKTHKFSNLKEIVSIDKKKKLPSLSSNYSSPIISCFSNRKINLNNNKNICESQQNKSKNVQLEKDSNIVSSVNFSSTSNLIQEKDISNIINALDKSIMNDTLKITNFEKRNCEENVGVQYMHDLNLSGTNSALPVFQEDSSNIILENTKNIDEILNLNLSNDIPTNLSNIELENNPEIINKTYETANNLQSNSNSLSKNAKEREENINQIESENDEYGNQMSEWIKQTLETGNSYYLNSRTGMTSFGTPRNIDGCLVTKRHSFMPKGMSPIMLPTSTAVSKKLSPNSKSILHQTIANTENDDLQTVKWINFLQNKDSEKFFNELYSNNKNYETEIPNINKYKLPKKIIAGFENYSFSKDDFNKVTIINQCDNKFIVTKIEIQGKYDLLVLFDQHAVHERILLEKLLKDYEVVDNKLKSVKCKTSIKLTVDDFEISMLQNYRNNFENWGLVYEIKGKKSVTFTQIPLCWQSKDDSNLKQKEYSIIETLIMALIQEESNWLRNIRTINMALPLAIQNTIKTEACRTAVKFGDPLSKEQCENLIKELLLCDLPFNCAHGRPTIVPIIDLNNINCEDEDEEINLNILKT